MVHFEAAGIRFEREQRGRAWLAWHIGVFHPRRIKRFPRLEELIGRAKPQPAAQSWQAIRDIGRMWTVVMGGTVTKRK